MAADRLFVYGSLRRSAPGNHHPFLRGARFVGVATIRGRLYDIGPHSVVVSARSGGLVHGELYELPADAAAEYWRTLDEYEGSGFKRIRVFANLRNGTRRVTWVYTPRKRPPKSARLIESGRYTDPDHASV
jgi:gamma-glutamylcyclotransferase (GGCT)/AIG2-like uncharacterized protein YtfP